jgi:threonine dehydrogenase-like Zn-dependent dehydrogenase
LRFLTTQLSVPFFPFFFKEVKLLSSCCYNSQDFAEVMDLMSKGEFESFLCMSVLTASAGRFQGYEKMVTSRVSLEDVVAGGFEELVNNKDDHIKILISPKKE